MITKYKYFRKNLEVPDNTINQLSTEEEFNIIYDEFFKYLQTLDFKKLNEDVDDLDINLAKIKEISKIMHYASKLSNSKYKQYLENTKIPNRTTEPNYNNLNAEEREIARSKYQEKLKIEERDIRIKYFIKELIKKYSIYYDPNILNYYLNFFSLILLQYCNSHPEEKTTVHCRIKSPLGIVYKLINKIMLESTFSRDPNSGTDTLNKSDISDLFGAKIISSRDHDPICSIDEYEQKLIDNRETLNNDLKPFSIFRQTLESTINQEDVGEQKITYHTYFNKCTRILHRQLILTLFNILDKKFNIKPAFELYNEILNDDKTQKESAKILDDDETQKKSAEILDDDAKERLELENEKEAIKKEKQLITELSDMLDKQLKAKQSEEPKVISYIKEQIKYINKKADMCESNGTLNTTIGDFSQLLDDKRTNYFTFYKDYKSSIPNDLNLFSLKKGFNRILNQTRKTKKDLAMKDVFKMFGKIQHPPMEHKYTPSGHNAIHYDIIPPAPLQCCECQLQTILDYNSDKNGPTNAHSNMKGKKLILVPLPVGQESKPTPNTLNQYIYYNGLYYSKKEIKEFRKAVNIIVPTKFRISYDLGTIKIERYTTYQDYLETAKELPPDDPYREDVDEYFKKLKELPECCFTYPNAIVNDNIKLSDIKAFIEHFSQIFDISIDTNEAR